MMQPVRRLLIVFAACLPSMASGQVTVQLGLGYNPDPLRSVAIVPVKGGPYADSIGAIVQRDIEYSDRVTPLALGSSITPT